MESYYSSDEEIAWGPLTLREVKKELQREPRKIERRHTDLGRSNYSIYETNSISGETETASNNSATSAYFTPNESAHSELNLNKNDLFLKKLSQVIDGNINDDLNTSLYATALESTVSKPVNDTLFKIIKSQEKYCDLDKIQQTLVENSLLSPNKNSNDNLESTIEVISDDSSCSESDDVILISDNSSNSSIDQIDYLPIKNSIKPERLSAAPQSKDNSENLPKPNDLPLTEEEDPSSGTEDLLSELNCVREKLINCGSDSTFSDENEDLPQEDQQFEDLENSENEALPQENQQFEDLENSENEALPQENQQFENLENSENEDLEITSSDIEDLHHVIEEHGDVEVLDHLDEQTDDTQTGPQLSCKEQKDLNTEDLYVDDQLAEEEDEFQAEEMIHPEEKQNSNLKVDDHPKLHQSHHSEEHAYYQEFSSSSEVEDVNEKMKFMNLDESKLNISGVRSLSVSSRPIMPMVINAEDYKEEISENSSSSNGNSLHSESSNRFLKNPAPSFRTTESDYTSDSQGKNDSFTFNDTIEEIEMALKHGLDYMMPEDKTTLKEHPDIVTTDNFLTCEQKAFLTPRPDMKTKVQKTLTAKKFDYVQSRVGDYIRKKSPGSDNFKLPLRPPRSKLTSKHRSPLIQSKHYKNAVSPVGIYIKNSPVACLKQNVPVKTLPRLIDTSPTTEVTRSNTGNVSGELPGVIYKPAKKTVASTKKEINIPSNIENLIPKVIIAKHEKRVNERDLKQTLVRKKLLEEDLTSTTVDFTLLNQSSEDMSFVTNKQAFIK